MGVLYHKISKEKSPKECKYYNVKPFAQNLFIHLPVLNFAASLYTKRGGNMVFFQNIKKSFIWILSVIIFAFSVFGGLIIFAGKPGQIETNGECIARIFPDRTAINLNIRVLDKNSGVALSVAQKIADNLINFAKNLGDKTLEMQTVRLESYEKTEWDNVAQKSISLGYETTIAVEISSGNRENIEFILKNLPTENVYTENLRMYVSNEKLKPAIENCLGGAVENARNQASKIAIAEGLHIGKMISAKYNTVTNGNDPRPMFMKTSENLDSGLVAKDSEISVTVNAIFETR